MPISNTQAIILAAGRSSRFNKGQTKLIETICGQQMVLYITKLLDQCNIPITVVTGYQKELVETCIITEHGSSVAFVLQEQQLGTGHALAITQPQWHQDFILVLNADTPLVNKNLIERLYEEHIQTDACISIITTCLSEPHAYGRVITTPDGIVQIIEAKDFTGDSQERYSINAGIYLFNRTFLEKFIDTLSNANKAGEVYLTDLIGIASKNGYTVSTIKAPFDQIRGVNTLQELWAAEQIKRAELIRHWMDQGVRFFAPHTVHIDLEVNIGSGSSIGFGVHLLGNTQIGKNCTVEPFSIIKNSNLHDNVTIYNSSVISNSIIKSQVQVGPFAHVKWAVVEHEAIIGNFVEITRSHIGQYTKAKHHTYLGDAQVEDHVNIGAGTITCNHDGTSKHQTIIKRNAYIGSNNSLVAPITIEEGAFTAAGSTITNDVPANALAIARSHQINKHGYATKLREKKQKNNLSSSAKKHINQHNSSTL